MWGNVCARVFTFAFLCVLVLYISVSVYTLALVLVCVYIMCVNVSVFAFDSMLTVCIYPRESVCASMHKIFVYFHLQQDLKEVS